MRILKFIPKLTANAAAYIIRLARFVAVLIVFYALYRLLLEQFFDGSKEIIPLLGLWLLSAYIVIPRIHRLLTKYYLPNYFVGRIRSPDGLLSDPVNLAFYADTSSDIHSAMQAAGWQRADPLAIKNIVRSAYSAIFRKSYPTAPVGNMYLFNRPQDFTYQQQVGGSPNERHHVRFWKTPEGWHLPGGKQADWLAAGTYDTHVGIKIATGQIDHMIHSHVDEERDYIIQTLQDAKKIKKLTVVEHFTDAFHDRNNGGDRIKTDGSLPFISL